MRSGSAVGTIHLWLPEMTTAIYSGFRIDTGRVGEIFIKYRRHSERMRGRRVGLRQAARISMSRRVAMTDLEEFEGRTPERRSAEEVGGRTLRDTLHLRQQLDRWIDAWVADITTT